MKITHPFLMKLASIITILVLFASTQAPIATVFADDVPAAESSATGGDGGTGGSGGTGDTGGTGGDGGTGGAADGTSTGDTSSTGGEGGDGGTGGGSTSGTGTGGDGGTGGTGGDATNTSDGGTSDATGGSGGGGGTGGDSQNGGTAGDGGGGATGGTADSNSTTDDGSDADANAIGGDAGDGGAGGDGSGAQSDGGTGGDGSTGGGANADAAAQEGGDASADAQGGNGGDGGNGGGGGSAYACSDGYDNDNDGLTDMADPECTTSFDNAESANTETDGSGSSIHTGDASSSSTAQGQANTTDATVPPQSEEGQEEALQEEFGENADVDVDAETSVELGNVLGATTTASSTASSGGNMIDDADGADIMTGMANSFSWIFALFNVAVVNSTGAIHFYKNPVNDALNFTQRFIDAFSALAQNGACSLLGCDGVDGVTLKIFNDNVAEVDNVAISRSQTGDNNAIANGGSSLINTGDADAMSGIVNVGNLTMVDSRYLLIFMANQGDLEGDILLPDGAFFEQLSTGASIGAASDISASSTADLTNNASTTAETGANGANGTEGSIVDSGNANANSSAVNFANQLGAPICFLVSTGGDWNGDIVQLPARFAHERTSFGDVICGAGGASRDPITGLELEVVNYAKIFNTAIAEAVTGNNYAEGLLAKVATGDANAFAQILNLVNLTLVGQDWIFANFAISGDWDGDLVFGVKPGEDDILGDLIEEHVLGGSPTSFRSATPGGYEPNISFTKEASVTQATSPATVEYTITVHNTGGEAKQVVVNDTMKGPDGSTIGKQMWKLGTVKHNEEVKITYTIKFEGDVEPGYYTNTAVLTGMKNLAIGLETLTATDVVEVLPPGEVLAAKTCEPVLTEYIRPWRVNNPDQVKALQQFLNAYESEDLAVTGLYDAATQAAVKAYQVKYSSDILAPWGITLPTGNVYYTTQKKVNQMACADLDFSLTEEQQAEIEAFKSSTDEAKEETIKKGNTGSVPKNLLKSTVPMMPVFFTEPLTGGKTQPTSMLSLPMHLLSSFATPFVEAMEM